MKNLTNIFLGVGIGAVVIGNGLLIGVAYLLDKDKKIFNIGPLVEGGRDAYLLERGIGKFKSQTLYWPTVIKEKIIKDGNSLNIIYDTVQMQSSKKLSLGKDFFKSEEYIKSREYVKLGGQK